MRMIGRHVYVWHICGACTGRERSQFGMDTALGSLMLRSGFTVCYARSPVVTSLQCLGMRISPLFGRTRL